MDLKQAETMARDCMRWHGLSGWAFAWDNARARHGLCSHSRRTISMSKPVTELKDAASVLNTILHEIAHALVGPRFGHSYVWRSKAIEIGSDGQRCTSFDAASKLARFQYACVDCETKIYRQRRLTFLDQRYHVTCKRRGRTGALRIVGGN